MNTERIQIRIPSEIKFSDLKLAFDEYGVSFDWGPIERICHHNALSLDLFKKSPEDNVASLIVQWYGEHRASGGDPDPVAEEYIAEVLAENAAGLITESKTKNQ